MKKEMIISILVGLTFGLIIVYGVYTAQKSLSDSKNTPNVLEVSPTPSDDTPVDTNLVIHNPEDEIIVAQPQLTVTGTTTAGNYVVIFINDQPFITQADEVGSFSIEAQLELGSNVIQVRAIDENGHETVKERVVIYTTKPLVESDDQQATDSATATASAKTKDTGEKVSK